MAQLTSATADAMSLQYLHFRQQVEELFDDYAEDFEASLHGLGYDVPRLMLGELEAVCGSSDFSHTTAIDLGCGTGLAGVQLRPRCKGRLIGCDLSAGILQQAEKKRRMYDKLEQADAVAFVRRLPAASADLVVATDVIVYMHALADLFAGVRRVLSVGGVFAFSTELCTLEEAGGLPPSGGNGWVERPSERIAHCEEYVHWLLEEEQQLQQPSGKAAAADGSAGEGGSARLRLQRATKVMVRRDGNGKIMGQLFYMTKELVAASPPAPSQTSDAATSADGAPPPTAEPPTAVQS